MKEGSGLVLGNGGGGLAWDFKGGEGGSEGGSIVGWATAEELRGEERRWDERRRSVEACIEAGKAESSPASWP